MRPYINNYSYNKLAIPELSGGVNLRDNISLVYDNQLTDCKNVWYKDGMLRTRAALKATNFNDMQIQINRTAMSYGETLVYMSDKNVRVINGYLYFLAVLKSSSAIYVRYLSVENAEVPIIEVAKITDLNSQSFNVFQHKNDIYIFGSVENENSLVGGLPIYKIWEENGEWKKERIQQSGAYVPTIYMNLSTGYYDSFSGVYGATMLEGFNLLGKRYKLLYNNAKEYQSPSEEKIKEDVVHLTLIDDVSEFVGEKVVVKITEPDGTLAVHEATILGGDVVSNENGYNEVDGFQMSVYKRKISFRNINQSDMAFKRTQFMYNCIEVEAPCKNTTENLKKVLNCTFSEWYGGGSEGLYGGIHLFLGGNTEENEKALVLWSDINKPLYFSENCYAYVGDVLQRVTAFGKQGEALIIAKEKEMYATEYVNNSDALTEEAVQNQATVDITTDVIFPMYQVHGSIGCDCPNTMQLCRNRLVWACSNGKVYSLVSASAYNERSIYEVSGMVERRLKIFSRQDLQQAQSADWQGHYVLAVGTELFLMDYNSYGFSNVYSYSKTEDAQSRVPWWIWDINVPDYAFLKRIANINDNLYFAMVLKDGMGQGYFDFVCFDGEGKKDNFPYLKLEHPEGVESGPYEWHRLVGEKQIPTMLVTKCYDFNSPNVLKNIPKVKITFGANEGVPITVTTITDKGESDCDVYLESPELDSYTVGHFASKVIRPSIQRANRLMLKCECNGNMAIDNITIMFKQLGGLK